MLEIQTLRHKSTNLVHCLQTIEKCQAKGAEETWSLVLRLSPSRKRTCKKLSTRIIKRFKHLNDCGSPTLNTLQVLRAAKGFLRSKIHKTQTFHSYSEFLRISVLKGHIASKCKKWSSFLARCILRSMSF